MPAESLSCCNALLVFLDPARPAVINLSHLYNKTLELALHLDKHLVSLFQNLTSFTKFLMKVIPGTLIALPAQARDYVSLAGSSTVLPFATIIA